MLNSKINFAFNYCLISHHFPNKFLTMSAKIIPPLYCHVWIQFAFLHTNYFVMTLQAPWVTSESRNKFWICSPILIRPPQGLSKNQTKPTPQTNKTPKISFIIGYMTTEVYSVPQTIGFRNYSYATIFLMNSKGHNMLKNNLSWESSSSLWKYLQE